ALIRPSQINLATCEQINIGSDIVSVPSNVFDLPYSTVVDYKNTTSNSSTTSAIRINSTSISPLIGSCYGNPTECCRLCSNLLANEEANTSLACGTCVDNPQQECQYSCTISFAHTVSLLIPDKILNNNSSRNGWSKIAVVKYFGGDMSSSQNNDTYYSNLIGARMKCYYIPKYAENSLTMETEYQSPVPVTVIVLLVLPSGLVVVCFLHLANQVLRWLAFQIWDSFIRRTQGSISQINLLPSIHRNEEIQDNIGSIPENNDQDNTPEPNLEIHLVHLSRIFRRFQWLIDDIAIALVIGVVVPLAIFKPLIDQGIISSLIRRILQVLSCVLIIVGLAPFCISFLQASAGLVCEALGLQSKQGQNLRAESLAAAARHTHLHSEHRVDLQSTRRRIRWIRWAEAIVRPQITTWVVITIYVMLVMFPVLVSTLVGMGRSGTFGNIATFEQFSVSILSNGVHQVMWKPSKLFLLIEFAGEIFSPIFAAFLFFYVILVAVVARVRAWKSVDINNVEHPGAAEPNVFELPQAQMAAWGGDANREINIAPPRQRNGDQPLILRDAHD
ncbi:hypothetical protein HK096_008322, partial [Nowakowskiella sp. JEL0078]